MTPRTLFIVILRVLGILFLNEVLRGLIQSVSTIVTFFSFSAFTGLFMVVISLLIVAFYISISYLLIFKADYLVTRFALDQGIKEPVLQFNISISSILRIAIIITGSLVLFSEIPVFSQIVFGHLQERDNQFFQRESIDWSPAVFSGVKIIIGLLIIGERRRILEFLTRSPEQEIKEPNSEN